MGARAIGVQIEKLLLDPRCRRTRASLMASATALDEAGSGKYPLTQPEKCSALDLSFHLRSSANALWRAFIMTHITLTKTESSRNGVAFFEGDQDIGYETAAVAASASPLGIMSMGTFPSSLIAWARSGAGISTTCSRCD
jgi:hypothetical protein